MRHRIDLKSLLIGGLLAVVVVCVMGGVPMVSPEFQGRFSLVAQNVVGGDVFVIDTVTGQVWERHRNMIPNPFYEPKLEGYAPAKEPVDPNRL